MKYETTYFFLSKSEKIKKYWYMNKWMPKKCLQYENLAIKTGWGDGRTDHEQTGHF